MAGCLAGASRACAQLARGLRAACARLARILSCELLIVDVMTAEALASIGV